jgi:peptide deformylase
LKIRIYPDNCLKQQTESVDTYDAHLGEIIDAMFYTMEQSMGLGLAGPQIGINKQIIVVDVDKIDAIEERPEFLSHGKFVFINPKIESVSKNILSMKEGCLSVPGVSEIVERSEAITLSFNDATGNKQTIKACGLLSRCIQHEIDHLEGKLFIDRLSKLKRDIVLKKFKKSMNAVNQLALL